MKPVHYGHLHIHEHKVNAAVANLFNRRKTVGGHTHGKPGLGQQLAGDLGVDIVILHHKYSAVRRGCNAKGTVHNSGGFFLSRGGLRNGFALLHPAEGQFKEKAAPLAGCACHRKLAAHEVDQLPRQRKPEAKATV